MKKRFEYIVITRPVGDRDAEFNRWYDEIHLPEVVAVPGFVGARRFRIEGTKPEEGGLPAWRYVAIYEMECEDPAPVLAELFRRANGEFTMTDTLDMNSVATLLVSQISELRK
jgi:hypothetical protein